MTETARSQEMDCEPSTSHDQPVDSGRNKRGRPKKHRQVTSETNNGIDQIENNRIASLVFRENRKRQLNQLEIDLAREEAINDVLEVINSSLFVTSTHSN